MRGIILAAGRGSRLNGQGSDLPKCLVAVGDETLLGRNIRLLHAAGIDDVVTVIGCGADAVRRSVRDVTFVENERFAQTNSLYSLWLARPWLAGGAIVMNCDVLLHPQLLTDLLGSRYEDALLVAYREPDARYGDEEMKVRVRCGRVIDIAKTIEAEQADGENLGVAKFGVEGARVLTAALDARVAAGDVRGWAPRAFRDFTDARPLYAIGTRGLPWVEIDFPDDYRHAVDVVLPAIETIGLMRTA